jgi:hypothetical protein
MVAFLAIGTFVGIVLGLRFSVFILVPAILLAIAVIAATDTAVHQSTGVIVVTVLATTALLQIGYVVGRVLKVAAERRTSAPLTPSLESEPENQSSERHTENVGDDVDSPRHVLDRSTLPANSPDATSGVYIRGSEAPPIFDAEQEETSDTAPSAGKRLTK